MSRRASSRVLYFLRRMRSRLSRLKKLSATALSQQFPRRLMLGTRLCCSRTSCHSASELRTLVRMNMDLGLWFAPPDGHEQGLQRQVCIGATLHRPTDHAPRKQINHDRQIQEPLVGADVGY